jgi:hypothetical protein
MQRIVLLSSEMHTEKSRGDRFAHVLGICGFCIGIISLGWQVYLYKDSLTERVTVRASTLQITEPGSDDPERLKKNGFLAIEVVNVGQRALYLRQVRLEVPCESIVGQQGWTFYGDKMPNVDTMRLEPGASHTFQKKWDFGAYPLHADDGATKDYCVTVTSTKGEILRTTPQITEIGIVESLTSPKH